jgi:hypothetical protein
MSKRRIEDIKRDFYNLFKILVPSNSSVNLTKNLWDNWENANFTRPNVDDIAAHTIERNRQFFHEIVKIAGKALKKDLNIEYCPFILNDYNFSAISADDGYLVLIDEAFFGMLFFLILIFIFDMRDLIQEEDKSNIMSFINNTVDIYINHKYFNAPDSNITFSLTKKDYDTAEFATYFSKSIEIFIIAHEISHHILGHTKETIKKNMVIGDHNVEIEVDKREKLCEFEADELGYKIFLEVMNTTDNSIDVAYCKYRFEYAPLFFFDLVGRLDELKGMQANNYITHPTPTERKENLLKHYKIEDPNYLYRDLVGIMKSNIKVKP